MTKKLTSTYFKGLSVIRQGASDAEIIATVQKLMSAPEAGSLYGAIVVTATTVRSCGSPAKHFCVYDTDAPEAVSHGDIVGTFDQSLSKNAWGKEQGRRRYALRDALLPFVVEASTPGELLIALRTAGI